MEKDACAMRVSARPIPKFMWKNGLYVSGQLRPAGLVAKSFRGSIRVARSLLCSSPFFKPLQRFLEILSSPVPRIWPFTASVTIFEGSEDFRFLQTLRVRSPFPNFVKMARKMPARDQIVKLIVGAGQASPSPPVGPALGSKGVKSMDFCKVPTFCIRSAVSR